MGSAEGRYVIGRLHFVPPRSGELFYLRLLLNYVRGPTSYDDLKTFDGVKLDSFKEVCEAMGFLDDDKEFIDAIVEAAHWSTGTYLRLLFTTLLLSDQFSRPDFVLNSTWQYLSDDSTQRQRHRLRVQGKF